MNMAFTAGPAGEGHVKIGEHLFMFFGLHQKSGYREPDVHNKAG